MKLKEKNKFRDVPIFSNIKEVIYNSVKLYKNNVAFVTKVKKEDKKVEYINHTYQNLLDDVNSFGTSLYKLGLKGKRIAIFTHGNAMTFLMMKWCKVENVTPNKAITLSYNGKIIFNKRLNSPEVFKLTLDENNNVKNVENIEFADLEFDDFNI